MIFSPTQGNPNRNGERKANFRLALAHVGSDSVGIRHRAEQAVVVGVSGASFDGNLHYLCELGHEMSQEEETLPIEDVLGASFAARQRARYDWLGKRLEKHVASCKTNEYFRVPSARSATPFSKRSKTITSSIRSGIW